jgi:predicted NodU family carbamoyl transferase
LFCGQELSFLASNSVMNGKIRQHTPFEEVYIQPAAGDNGTALGAAFYVWHQVLGQPRRFVMEQVKSQGGRGSARQHGSSSIICISPKDH